MKNLSFSLSPELAQFREVNFDKKFVKLYFGRHFVDGLHVADTLVMAVLGLIL